MSVQTSSDKCPLCLEEMDFTDKELKPCKCGCEVKTDSLRVVLVCIIFISCFPLVSFFI
jgi:hypothetical protein